MDFYKNEVNAFVDAIIQDTPVPVGVYDGLKSVVIGMATKKSFKEGRLVKISEIPIE